MKTVKLEVPDRLAKEIEGLVEAGWFASQAELARLALTEFVQRHRFELEEKLQRDDLRWALELRHRAGYAAHPVAPGEFDAWEDEQVWPG